MCVSILTFILGAALGGIGVFIQQTTSEWAVASIDLFGWLLMCSGAFFFILSLVGICASRSGSLMLLFIYFVMLLLLLSAVLLACLYTVLEKSRIYEYLQSNWSSIQAHIGDSIQAIGSSLTSNSSTASDESLSFAEAYELLTTYYWVIVAVGGVALAVLTTSFIAAARMLGARAIATSMLIALGLLGLVEAGIAYLTLDSDVPRATSYLLFGCAGVQLLASVTGICGFRYLNRECLCASSLVLILGIAALAYVAGATYLWLRDAPPDNPMPLLLVFGVAAVADFFMLSTLTFTCVVYCRRRKAFTASERSAQLQEEYSDYASREPTNGGRGKKKRKKGHKVPRSREYLPSDHL